MKIDTYGFTSLDHMTHIDNLESIFKYGLLAHNNPYKQIDISNTEVNARREGRESLQIMKEYLSNCNIEIEIWHFDPIAKDDFYEEFKSIFKEIDNNTIKEKSKIRIDKIKKIRESLDNPNINTLSGLLRVKGVGEKSLENLYIFISNYKKNNVNLFNFDS